MFDVNRSANNEAGGRVRKFAPVAAAVIAAVLALPAPAAGAASLSVSRFLPRINLDVMLDVERASPAGSATGAARATDPVAADAVRGAREADIEPADADEPVTVPPRAKPGTSGGTERAPRWKSLIPGALK